VRTLSRNLCKIKLNWDYLFI